MHSVTTKKAALAVLLVLAALLSIFAPDGGIGRRAGLKHQWIHFHPGSTPGLGTKIKAK